MRQPNWNPEARVRELSCRLVEWGSETGSLGEAAFGERLAGLLRDIPYFRERPDQVRLVDSHGDPMTRSVVAIVRGKGMRALAMAGHYDVVSIDNYRDLAPLAFKPDELLGALISDLENRPLKPGERRALEDFKSGEFLPGRGLLDMKSGLAAGIAVLEDFAADPERSGSLVFIATPDEERGSRGMRSLRDALPALAAEFGLDIEAGINLDATSDQGNGEEGRAIYRGTIGKALPFAFIVGQSSHASYPFEGVSAQLIASEIIRSVEANPTLCDTAAGEVSPPPVCLEAKDLRGGYEVTTPERVWVAFNWLSHNWTARDLLGLFKQKVRTGAAVAIQQFNKHVFSYAAMLGATPAAPVAEASLISIEELREQVKHVGGPDAVARVRSVDQGLRGTDDPLAQTRAIVGAMATEAGVTGPAVVYGFSSLVYPSTHLSRVEGNAAFADAIEAARLAHEKAGGCPLKYREYFTGISDMSFFGHSPLDRDSAYVAANTPTEALVDIVRKDALSFPVVNIGPWGREFHQRLERVHTPYAFEELPRFLREVVKRFLD
ncbi:arginine utilization protein RocB [Ancylobacter sp. 3268]|uniref:M20/M25/M40 family metallo-hydrolase n=1 Tax=Ancylobacter sp. 3268 TaxID=2817752 RepID=UPI00285DC3B1|nr:M20/M25/M40 family metallo-hydrolase [Ancylobacter sp. 3268]MDR6953626.1 arginine utilization protein RocB [Ancylobacter sp. 3268]